MLRFKEDGAVLDVLVAQLREHTAGFGLPHDVRRGAREGRHAVVDFEDERGQDWEKSKEPVVEGGRADVPATEGDGDGNPVGKMSLLRRHVPPLPVAIHDHFDLPQEFPHCLHWCCQEPRAQDRNACRG